MSSPASPSSRARTNRAAYVAFFVALLTTSNSAAAANAKRCELATKQSAARKAACDRTWGVCFYLDEKGNEVSKDCTANELRALAINCRDSAVAAQQRKTACSR